MLCYLTMVGFVSTPVPQAFLVPDRDVTIKELAGLASFQENKCYSCHSVQGVGMKHAPDLWRVARKRTPQWIEDLLKDPDTTLGEPGEMVQYFLSDKEIGALTAYVSSLDLSDYRAKRIDPAVFQGASVVYDNECLACHRIGGEGNGRDVPGTFKGDELAQFLSGEKGHHTRMPMVMNRDDAEKVARFFAAME